MAKPVANIENPKHALYPTFYSVDDDGEVFDVERSRQMNVELRGNEFWVEPADLCGVHYVFPFDELEAMVAAHAVGEKKPPKPERLDLDPLRDQVDDLEAKLVQAEGRRDDSEQRIQAILEWADENGVRADLDHILGQVVAPAEQ